MNLIVKIKHKLTLKNNKEEQKSKYQRKKKKLERLRWRKSKKKWRNVALHQILIGSKVKELHKLKIS